jgi:hypothetical protein
LYGDGRLGLKHVVRADVLIDFVPVQCRSHSIAPSERSDAQKRDRAEDDMPEERTETAEVTEAAGPDCHDDLPRARHSRELTAAAQFLTMFSVEGGGGVSPSLGKPAQRMCFYAGTWPMSIRGWT